MSKEINDILRNALHWDTCPEEYKTVIIRHLNRVEQKFQCKTFERDKYTSGTQCKKCDREVWQHRVDKNQLP